MLRVRGMMKVRGFMRECGMPSLQHRPCTQPRRRPVALRESEIIVPGLRAEEGAGGAVEAME